MGASTMLLALAKSYGALVAYAIVFSAADEIMITTFIIVSFASVDELKRASTFEFIMMSSGVTSLSSPPLLGMSKSHYSLFTRLQPLN